MEFDVWAVLSGGAAGTLISIIFQHFSNERLERARHEMEKDALKLQIQYGSFAERRFQFLLDLYASLLALKKSSHSFIHAAESQIGEAGEKLQDNFFSARELFDTGRVLLDKDLDEEINEVLWATFQKSKSLGRHQRVLESPAPPPNAKYLEEILEKYQDNLQDAYEKIEGDIRNRVHALLSGDSGVEESRAESWFSRLTRCGDKGAIRSPD